jgi:hypothetical protein
VHDWLEERGPRTTLVGVKDDATGHVWARFAPAETTWAYLDLMMEVLTDEGVPLSLYSDRHTIFHILGEPTLVEQLKDIHPLTQFGRAMDELGVTRYLPPRSSAPLPERPWRTSPESSARKHTCTPFFGLSFLSAAASARRFPQGSSGAEPDPAR